MACLLWNPQQPDHTTSAYSKPGPNEGSEGQFLCSVLHLYLSCSSQAAIGQSNLTEEALEELSEAREPRQRAGGGVAPQTNLPKFATWAGGEQPQLDSVTISKHVKQMVDVSC